MIAIKQNGKWTRPTTIAKKPQKKFRTEKESKLITQKRETGIPIATKGEELDISNLLTSDKRTKEWGLTPTAQKTHEIIRDNKGRVIALIKKPKEFTKKEINNRIIERKEYIPRRINYTNTGLLISDITEDYYTAKIEANKKKVEISREKYEKARKEYHEGEKNKQKIKTRQTNIPFLTLQKENQRLKLKEYNIRPEAIEKYSKQGILKSRQIYDDFYKSNIKNQKERQRIGKTFLRKAEEYDTSGQLKKSTEKGTFREFKHKYDDGFEEERDIYTKKDYEKEGSTGIERKQKRPEGIETVSTETKKITKTIIQENNFIKELQKAKTKKEKENVFKKFNKEIIAQIPFTNVIIKGKNYAEIEEKTQNYYESENQIQRNHRFKVMGLAGLDQEKIQEVEKTQKETISPPKYGTITENPEKTAIQKILLNEKIDKINKILGGIISEQPQTLKELYLGENQYSTGLIGYGNQYQINLGEVEPKTKNYPEITENEINQAIEEINTLVGKRNLQLNETNPLTILALRDTLTGKRDENYWSGEFYDTPEIRIPLIDAEIIEVDPYTRKVHEINPRLQDFHVLKPETYSELKDTPKAYRELLADVNLASIPKRIISKIPIPNIIPQAGNIGQNINPYANYEAPNDYVNAVWTESKKAAAEVFDPETAAEMARYTATLAAIDKAAQSTRLPAPGKWIDRALAIPEIISAAAKPTPQNVAIANIELLDAAEDAIPWSAINLNARRILSGKGIKIQPRIKIQENIDGPITIVQRNKAEIITNDLDGTQKNVRNAWENILPSQIQKNPIVIKYVTRDKKSKVRQKNEIQLYSDGSYKKIISQGTKKEIIKQDGQGNGSLEIKEGKTTLISKKFSNKEIIVYNPIILRKISETKIRETLKKNNRRKRTTEEKQKVQTSNLLVKGKLTEKHGFAGPISEIHKQSQKVSQDPVIREKFLNTIKYIENSKGRLLLKSEIEQISNKIKKVEFQWENKIKKENPKLKLKSKHKWIEGNIEEQILTKYPPLGTRIRVKKQIQSKLEPFALKEKIEMGIEDYLKTLQNQKKLNAIKYTENKKGRIYQKNKEILGSYNQKTDTITVKRNLEPAVKNQILQHEYFHKLANKPWVRKLESITKGLSGIAQE